MSFPLGILFSKLNIRTDSPLQPAWRTKGLERRLMRKRTALSNGFTPMDPELVQTVTMFYLLEKDPAFSGYPVTRDFLEDVRPLLIDEANRNGYLYVRNSKQESVVLNLNRALDYEFDFSLTFYPKRRLATTGELREHLYPIVDLMGTRHGFKLMQDDVEEQ